MGYLGDLFTKAQSMSQKAFTTAKKVIKDPQAAMREQLEKQQAAAKKAANVSLTAKAYKAATGKELSAEEKGTVGQIIGITGGPTAAVGGFTNLLSILTKIGIGLTAIMAILFLYVNIDSRGVENLPFMSGTAANALVSSVIFGILTVLSLIGLAYMGTTGSALDAVKRTNTVYLVMISLFSALISLAWWQIAEKVDARMKAAKEAETRAAQLQATVAAAAAAEGFQNAGGEVKQETEPTLLNSQPMTIKQAGYFGPAEGGKFKPEEAVTQALKSGFRSFVLKIDYLNGQKDPQNFEKAGEPTLLYTSESGSLLSSNSGSIEKVSKAIFDVAFTPTVPNYTHPVMLYLHVNRAPSPTKEPERHMQFLSKIAKQLGPLSPFHLGLTPLGIFHRQKNQDALLTAPLSSLQGQVIIASNVNTDMFRIEKKSNEKRYAPADDLDYWVNLRVNLDTDDDSMGLAQMAADSKQSRAVVVPASRILSLKGPKADSFALKGKQRFVIAMTDPYKNPTSEDLDYLLNTLGVNMVPLDIFSDDLDSTKALLRVYENKSFRSKPEALQKI